MCQENLMKKQEQNKEKEMREKNKEVTITNHISKLGGSGAQKQRWTAVQGEGGSLNHTTTVP